MVHDPQRGESFEADLAALLTETLTGSAPQTEFGVFDRIQQLMKYWTPELRSKKAKRQLRDDKGRFREELFDLDWLKGFGKPKKRAELPADRARIDTTPTGLIEGEVEEVDELNLPEEPLKSPTYNLAEFNAAHEVIKPTGTQPRVPHWYLSDPSTASLLRRWLSTMQFQPDGDWRTRGFIDDPDHWKKLLAELEQVEGVELVEEDPYTGEEVPADISPIQAKTLVAANISDQIADTISNEQLNDFVLRVNTIFDPYQAISAKRMTADEATKLLAEQHPYLDSSDFSVTHETGMDVLDAEPGEMYILDTATGKIAVAPNITGHQSDPKDRFITAEVGTPEGDTMVRDHLVSKIVRWWADTSNDNHVGSLAIQQVMHERLGDDVPVAPWDIEPDTLLQVAPIVTDHRDTINAILDAQQAKTLALLDALGIDQMRINRGLKVDEEGMDDAFDDPAAVNAWIQKLDASGQEFGMTTAGTVQRPLSSWARDVHIAANFAHDPDPYMEQFLLTTVVPKEEIMATALTGFGAFGESEVIPVAKLRPARVLHAITTPHRTIGMRDALRDPDLNSKLHEETILDLTINPDPNDLNADWIKTTKKSTQLYEDFDFPDIGWDTPGGSAVAPEEVDELNLPEIGWDGTEEVDELNAPEASHRGQHQPPDPEDAVSLDNLADPDIGTFPEDVYDTLQYYIHDQKPSQSDREAMQAVQRARGNPNAPVKVYRAAPVGVDTISPGDWVTTSPTYAEQHRLSREGGDEEYHVISGTVPAGTIHSGGNDIIEWGYWGDTPVPNENAATESPVERALTGEPASEPYPPLSDAQQEAIEAGTIPSEPPPGWEGDRVGTGVSDPYFWTNPETGEKMLVKKPINNDPREVELEEYASKFLQNFRLGATPEAQTNSARTIAGAQFAENSINWGSMYYGTEDRKSDLISRLRDRDEVLRLVVADMIAGNSDRNNGNLMIRTNDDGTTSLVPVDHGRFVNPIPRDEMLLETWQWNFQNSATKEALETLVAVMRDEGSTNSEIEEYIATTMTRLLQEATNPGLLPEGYPMINLVVQDNLATLQNIFLDNPDLIENIAWQIRRESPETIDEADELRLPESPARPIELGGDNNPVVQPLPTPDGGTSPVINVAGRPVVVVDVGGVKVPFYLSSGKNKKKGVSGGQWYPFFGVKGDGQWGYGGWFNKTSGMEEYYNNSVLKDVAERLDQQYGDIRDETGLPSIDLEYGRDEEVLQAINQGMTHEPTGMPGVWAGSDIQKNRLAMLQQLEDAFPGSNGVESIWQAEKVRDRLQRWLNEHPEAKDELDYYLREYDRNSLRGEWDYAWNELDNAEYVASRLGYEAEPAGEIPEGLIPLFDASDLPPVAWDGGAPVEDDIDELNLPEASPVEQALAGGIKEDVYITQGMQDAVAQASSPSDAPDGWEAVPIGDGASRPYFWRNPATGERMVVKWGINQGYEELEVEVMASDVLRAIGVPGMPHAEINELGQVVAVSFVSDAFPDGTAQSKLWEELNRRGRLAAIEAMADPWEGIRLLLGDTILVNTDRHSENLMVGWDAAGRMHLAPIDHGRILGEHYSEYSEHASPQDYIENLLYEGSADVVVDIARLAMKRIYGEHLQRADGDEAAAWASFEKELADQVKSTLDNFHVSWSSPIHERSYEQQEVRDYLEDIFGVNYNEVEESQGEIVETLLGFVKPQSVGDDADELNLPSEAAPFPQKLDDETRAVIETAEFTDGPPPGWSESEISEGDSNPYIWENEATGQEIIVKGPRNKAMVAPGGQFHEILAEKFGAEVFRAAGFPETPDVHLNAGGTLVGMSHASESLGPESPMPAMTWGELRVGQQDQIIGLLADPWQPMNMVLGDVAGAHIDRHAENFMVGLRPDGSAVVIPIDNGSYLYPGTEAGYDTQQEIDFLSNSLQRMVRASLERIVKENKLTKEETDELVYRKVMRHIELMESTAPDIGEEYNEFRERYLANIEKMKSEAPFIAEALVSFIDPVVYSEGEFDADKVGGLDGGEAARESIDELNLPEPVQTRVNVEEAAPELRETMEAAAGSLQQWAADNGLAVSVNGMGQTLSASFYDAAVGVNDNDDGFAGSYVDRFTIPGQVTRESMHLMPEYQGKGLGRQLAEQMQDTYWAQGYRSTGLHANSDVGAYAWAKDGYDYDWSKGKLPIDVDDINDKALTLYPKLGRERALEMRKELFRYAKRLRARDPDDLPTPMELLMVGHTPDAETWFGKELLLGYDAPAWNGIKPIAPPTVPSEGEEFDELNLPSPIEGVTEEPPPSIDTVFDHAHQVVTDVAAQYGLTAKMVRKKDRNGNFTPSASFDLYNANGVRVGHMERSLRSAPDGDGYILQNQKFELVKDYQGKGLGSKLTDALRDVYIEDGVKKIKLHANIDVGAYAWSKGGYDYDWELGGLGTDWSDLEGVPFAELGNALQDIKNNENREHVIDLYALWTKGVHHLQELRRTDPAQYLKMRREFERYFRRLLDLDPDDLPMIQELSKMGYTPDAKMWFGKQVLTGEGAPAWLGVQDLTKAPPSTPVKPPLKKRRKNPRGYKDRGSAFYQNERFDYERSDVTEEPIFMPENDEEDDGQPTDEELLAPPSDYDDGGGYDGGYEY